MLSLAMKVTGAGRLARGFDKAAKDTPDRMQKAVMRAGYLVQRAAKKNLTGGNPLNVQTNRLRSSVQVKTKGSGKTAESTVGTRVKYGAVHEHGATIMSTWGRGHTARQLTIPARPWLNPALESNRKKIVKLIDKEIQNMLKAAGL
jgi:phage gpG-like protein